MTHPLKRWLILGACVAANLCQGVPYSSSIYMKALGEALGRPESSWSREWAFIFAMGLCFLPVGTIVAGKMADAGKTFVTMLAGGLCCGLGIFLAGYSGSVLFTAAMMGAMQSLGAGMQYGTSIGVAVRWFPDRRGLASGLAVAAIGASPGLLAPIARYLVATYGVMDMLKIVGIACVTIMGAASFFVVNPPAGYAPEGWTPPEPSGGQAAVADDASLNWKQMIRVPLFWLLYVTYFCGAFSGILVNSLASPIAVELAGFTHEQSMFTVMLFSMANTGGRFLWGYLSDKFGRLIMIGVAFALTATAMFSLFGYVGSPGVLLPCIFIAGLCYGGVFGTYPSLMTDSFGVRYAVTNFALAFTAFSFGTIIAPQVAAHYRMLGVANYPTAFLVAGCVAVTGLVLSLVVSRLMAARKAAKAQLP